MLCISVKESSLQNSHTKEFIVKKMSVQGPQIQSTMTTKEMAKSFSPIILFSIVLPLIDIFTDLRLIIRLYSGIKSCNPVNVTWNEWAYCNRIDDLSTSTFCQQFPNSCQTEKHHKFATLLLGKFIKVKPCQI